MTYYYQAKIKGNGCVAFGSDVPLKNKQHVKEVLSKQGHIPKDAVLTKIEHLSELEYKMIKALTQSA